MKKDLLNGGHLLHHVCLLQARCNLCWEAHKSFGPVSWIHLFPALHLSPLRLPAQGLQPMSLVMSGHDECLVILIKGIQD